VSGFGNQIAVSYLGTAILFDDKKQKLAYFFRSTKKVRRKDLPAAEGAEGAGGPRRVEVRAFLIDSPPTRGR